MAEAVNLAAIAEPDALTSLKRTLRFHSLDPAYAFEKLHSLKVALDLQEATLLSWPDSPSRERMHESLGKARQLIVEMIDRFVPQDIERT